MPIHFNKMHGAGNSYIYIQSTTDYLQPDMIQHMCHQHYGIGGDGVVLICPSQQADVRMIMYNKDGSRGNICGNALRCVAKLLYHHHRQPQYDIQCDCGTITVDTIDSTHYTVHMPTVTILDNIDVSAHCPIAQLHTVNCGNNHAVIIADITSATLCQYMPVLDRHYLHGNYNVQVATVVDNNNVNAMVYERGSGLTLSCGSGAVAIMASLYSNNAVESPCNIHMPGGVLTVSYIDDHYTLTGDAHIVFTGDIL